MDMTNLEFLLHYWLIQFLAHASIHVCGTQIQAHGIQLYNIYGRTCIFTDYSKCASSIIGAYAKKAQLYGNSEHSKQSNR